MKISNKKIKIVALIIAGITGVFYSFKYGLYFYAQKTVKLNYDMKFKEKNEVKKYDVDTSFYKEFESICLNNGLKFIADIVDSVSNQTYIKTYIDTNGYYTASAYSIKSPENLTGIYGRYFNIYEIESETKSGDFITTTNAIFTKPIKTSPKIIKKYFELNTKLIYLFAEHEKYIRNKDNILKRLTLEGIIASANREQNISKEFRVNSQLKIREIKKIDKELTNKINSIK